MCSSWSDRDDVQASCVSAAEGDCDGVQSGCVSFFCHGDFDDVPVVSLSFC